MQIKLTVLSIQVYSAMFLNRVILNVESLAIPLSDGLYEKLGGGDIVSLLPILP